MSRDLTWIEAGEIAAESVRQKEAQTCADLLPSDAAALEKKRQKLAEESARIAQEEQRQAGIMRKWQELRSRRKSLRRVLDHAAYQHAEVASQLDGRFEYLRNEVWGHEHSPHAHPFRVVELYSLAAGVERALADYKGWREAREAELAAHEQAMMEFARQHGIKREHYREFTDK